MINIFTDASCLIHIGVAGWAALIRYPSAPAVELSGGELCGKINRMELFAVVKALSALPTGTTVTVWADSQYVMRGSEQFKRRDENADLWEVFDELKRVNVVFVKWVRAHSGHPDDEYVDKLAYWEAWKRVKPTRTLV